MLMMVVLVLFFVPGLAAGAIAGERERQTLATLQVTLLRPRSILVGKIAAALAYLAAADRRRAAGAGRGVAARRHAGASTSAWRRSA